jgi:3-phosphoshikimate 1-carboxyvinyltransferase
VADILATGGFPLRGVTIPKRLVPNLIDEIPALFALASIARGTMRVSGAAELHVKESDRIRTTVALLRHFNVRAQALPDGLAMMGAPELHAPKSVNTAGDHRIGLAAAILAAASKSALTIKDSACIATSFPGFAATWRAGFG